MIVSKLPNAQSRKASPEDKININSKVQPSLTTFTEILLTLLRDKFCRPKSVIAILQISNHSRPLSKTIKNSKNQITGLYSGSVKVFRVGGNVSLSLSTESVELDWSL